MLHAKHNAQELEKAIGPEKGAFLRKITVLQQKWQMVAHQDEYEETRVIAPFLFNKTKRTPVNTSILSDNIDYFKENYLKEYQDNQLSNLLEVACLSGSKKVAEFLLQKLGKTYSSDDCQFVLNYVTASPNLDWAMEIAHEMADKGLQMPEDLSSSLSNGEALKGVRAIFCSQQGYVVRAF